jgi:hypothetical protein
MTYLSARTEVKVDAMDMTASTSSFWGLMVVGISPDKSRHTRAVAL